MQKVVTINLNGNAYQVDEDAYALIDDYLRKATANLAPNPDIDEIMSDLEQALADKLRRFLGTNKTVVTTFEIKEALTEMGPVDSGLRSEEEPRERTSAGTHRAPDFARPEPRRLYRLKDEAMIEGVCAGLAAYFGLDPTIVRVIAVVLLATTAGAAGAIYLLLLWVIPEATTPEEKASAYGAPFSARDVLNQARTRFDDVTTGPGNDKWKRHWRAQERYWRRHANDPGSWLPFVLLFFGVFFLVSMVPRGVRGMTWSMPWIGVWTGPWLPILVVGAGLVVLFSGRRPAHTAIATILTVIAVVLFLAFAVTTIPVFQIWFGQMTMWWCSISPWGC